MIRVRYNVIDVVTTFIYAGNNLAKYHRQPLRIIKETSALQALACKLHSEFLWGKYT